MPLTLACEMHNYHEECEEPSRLGIKLGYVRLEECSQIVMIRNCAGKGTPAQRYPGPSDFITRRVTRQRRTTYFITRRVSEESHIS